MYGRLKMDICKKNFRGGKHTGAKAGRCSSESLAISISHGSRYQPDCGYDAGNPAKMPAATPNRKNQ